MSTTRRRGTRPAPPGRARVVMDMASFGLSWALIFQQALQPERFHVSFLVLAATMSGVPAAVAAASAVIRRGQLPPLAEASPVTTSESTP